MSGPSDVLRRALDAYVRSEREAIEALVAADHTFTSPWDNTLDRDSYFQISWPNAEGTTRFDVVELSETADDGVFVIYEGEGRQGRFRNCEFNRVRDGQLVSTEAYFGWSLPHPVLRGEHKGSEAGQ